MIAYALINALEFSLHRDELNSDLKIVEIKNLQSELGSEFAEYFSNFDGKIIIKNEKVLRNKL